MKALNIAKSRIVESWVQFFFVVHFHLCASKAILSSRPRGTEAKFKGSYWPVCFCQLLSSCFERTLTKAQLLKSGSLFFM